MRRRVISKEVKEVLGSRQLLDRFPGQGLPMHRHIRRVHRRAGWPRSRNEFVREGHQGGMWAEATWSTAAGSGDFCRRGSGGYAKVRTEASLVHRSGFGGKRPQGRGSPEDSKVITPAPN